MFLFVHILLFSFHFFIRPFYFEIYFSLSPFSSFKICFAINFLSFLPLFSQCPTFSTLIRFSFNPVLLICFQSLTFSLVFYYLTLWFLYCIKVFIYFHFVLLFLFLFSFTSFPFKFLFLIRTFYLLLPSIFLSFSVIYAFCFFIASL